MTMTQLTYFVAVAEQLNLTKVADGFRVSQPAVSAAIRDLEKEFQISLFIRQGKQIRLTPLGAQMYQRAKLLLTHYQDFIQSAAASSEESQPHRVGFTVNLSALHLSNLYEYMGAKGKADSFVAIEDSIANMLQMLHHGYLDIGCMAAPQLSEETTLSYFPVSQLGLYLCATPSLFHTEKQIVSISDLNTVPIMLQKSTTVHASLIEKCFAAAHVSPNVLLQTNQLFTMRHFIKRGLAAGILPPQLFRADDDIRSYPIKELAPLAVHLVYRKNDERSKRFSKLMKGYFDAWNSAQNLP